MTLRDIHIACSRIDMRRHNNYALQAALHGHKMKLQTVGGIKGTEPSDFTDNENDRAERAMQKAVRRMKAQQKR